MPSALPAIVLMRLTRARRPFDGPDRSVNSDATALVAGRPQLLRPAYVGAILASLPEGKKMAMKGGHQIILLWVTVLIVLLLLSVFHVFGNRLIVVWVVLCGTAAIITWRYFRGRRRTTK